jgi:hypothetical protein
VLWGGFVAKRSLVDRNLYHIFRTGQVLGLDGLGFIIHGAWRAEYAGEEKNLGVCSINSSVGHRFTLSECIYKKLGRV